MRISKFGQAAAVLSVAGVVLASTVQAQDRDRRDRRGAGDEATTTTARPEAAWEGGSWRWVGFGASIGASVRDTSAAEVTAAGLAQPGGAFVVSVTAGGPASKAGIHAGDVVVELDGERVRSAQHLGRLVGETAEGGTIKVAAVRDKARRTVEVTPLQTSDAFYTPEMRRRVEETVEEALARLRRHLDSEGFRRHFPFGARGRLGVGLLPLSDQLAAYFGVKEGALVTRVVAGSAAEQAGVKAGDVILSVEGMSVRSSEDVAAALAEHDGDTVKLSVMRDKKELSLSATLSAPRARPQGRARAI